MSQTLQNITQNNTGNSSFFSKLITDNLHFNIFYGLLIIGVASLPFTNFLMLPIAGLMLINWVAEWNWKEKWLNMRQNATIPTLIILFSIYLIVIYGFFLSHDKVRALAAFDCNLWFLFAPLFLLSSSPKVFTNNRIHFLLLIFALSTFLHILVIFSIAIHKYVETGNDIYFYYVYLSILRHPSYIAMYATFSFFFLIDYLNKTHKTLPLVSKVSIIIVMIVLLVGVFFLQSKAGIIVFGILTILWLFYLIFTRSTKIIAVLSIITALICVGIFMLHKAQWIPTNRFRDTIEDINNFKENQFGSGSSEIRLTVWKSSLEVSKKNLPWGVGYGDVTQELEDNAVKNNYTNLINHHYNAHNQYLQSLLTTGIPGIVALLAYCLLPILISIRKKHLLYFTFAVILILNIAVESMFQTRGGVDFIAIMNVLLLLRSK